MDVLLKFMYSEKAPKFCKISTVDLTFTTEDEFKVEISQNFVSFSEYMNFNPPRLTLTQALLVHPASLSLRTYSPFIFKKLGQCERQAFLWGKMTKKC